MENRPLQTLVAEAIAQGQRSGTLESAPIYGVRMLTHWHDLVITVASKLCMGQQRRNMKVATSEAGASTAGQSIYDMLQHYRLSPLPVENSNDPIRYLGRAMQWDCCGFLTLNLSSDASQFLSQVHICTSMDAAPIWPMEDIFIMNMRPLDSSNWSVFGCIHSSPSVPSEVIWPLKT